MYMKKYVFLIVCIIVAYGCSQKAEKSKPEIMLLGKVEKTDLAVEPYKSWFDSTYQVYSLNTVMVDSLKALFNGVEIELFYGTWCSDSRREVPAFYKILNELAGIDFSIESYALNRDKVEPDGAQEGHDIEFVPTIILNRGGVEQGRIIEVPERSLEEDMVRILK